MEPIKPSELLQKKKSSFEVIQVFNELIRENWDPRLKRAEFTQNHVTSRLMNRNRALTTTQILESGMLDICSEYKEAGWTVSADAFFADQLNPSSRIVFDLRT